MRASPINWEVFRRDFLDWLFPREKRKEKVEESINLHQRGMSVQDYSLKFTKLSMYAPFLVSNPRDEMTRFVMGVSNDLVDVCH